MPKKGCERASENIERKNGEERSENIFIGEFVYMHHYELKNESEGIDGRWTGEVNEEK